MKNRRQFIKILLTTLSGFLLIFTQAGKGLHILWAATKRRLIKRGTLMSELIHANPKKLDISNLETTPMEQFDVMGETTHGVEIKTWRLKIIGGVGQESNYSYDELLALPTIDRNALLICPGFFAYNGLWRGFSVASLLRKQGLKEGAVYVKFSGSDGFRRQTSRYKIEEVLRDEVFIAYQVNGQILPQRHGFPIRLVAQYHRGGRWVKYVNRVEVVTG